ncbi:MAG: type III secretion system protein [bacterium]|nr:type III secretion system protein [bacterium]
MRKHAVAIQYQPEENSAPAVVAKGKGAIADRIIEIAQAYGVPLYEDPDLVEVLGAIDLGREIPPELYKAMAEVLAFIYRVNGTAKDAVNRAN